MANRPLTLNIENFVVPSTGKPVALGNVYIGEKDTDPLIEANRKVIVVVEENGTETTLQPAAQPLTLTAGGVVQYNGSPVVVLVDGVYSIKVTDSLLAQVYYVPRANEYLEEVASDIGLLILNGSFENTTVDATKPDSWVITETSTGSIVIDTTVVNHGSKSLNFTSVDASGAGSAVTANRFNVSPNMFVNVDLDLISTAANTRTIVSLVWYNLAGSPVSTTAILDDSSANPTSWDTRRLVGQAPATAFSAELKIEGMAAGGGTVIGSTRFDNVNAFVSTTYFASFNGTTGSFPHDFTGLPHGTKTAILAFDGISLAVNASISVILGDKNGLATTGFTNSRVTYSSTPTISGNITPSSSAIIQTNNLNAAQLYDLVLTIAATDFNGFRWSANGYIFNGVATGTIGSELHGRGALSDFLTQLRINSSQQPDAGRISLTCHV